MTVSVARTVQRWIDNVKHKPTARQRLGKHIPAKRKRASEGRPLLGNEPANTPP
jgi:hypothetical protein